MQKVVSLIVWTHTHVLSLSLSLSLLHTHTYIHTQFGLDGTIKRLNKLWNLAKYNFLFYSKPSFSSSCTWVLLSRLLSLVLSLVPLSSLSRGTTPLDCLVISSRLTSSTDKVWPRKHEQYSPGGRVSGRGWFNVSVEYNTLLKCVYLWYTDTHRHTLLVVLGYRYF